MEIIISDNKNKGERIDIFLSSLFEAPRNRIQTLIKNKKILLNEKETKSAYKLNINDQINILEEVAENNEITPENIFINIIYEDEDIIVINKQSNLVVHPSVGNLKGTLVNALLYHQKKLSRTEDVFRPGIVHRLDKNTTGLLIIAKNDTSHTALTKMFKDNKIKKTYIAIVEGVLTEKTGTIITNIARDTRDRKKMAVSENGKKAITHYKVLEEGINNTLLMVNIETGRTHQIRVHMKHIGHPVLGDSTYGFSKKNIKNKIIERQMLHAWKLEFFHPLKDEKMFFEVKFPNDFNNALKKYFIKKGSDE